jgi:carbon monoxide dehydrogenase subunit G
MKIESRIGKSINSDAEIYEFITNFNNFRDLLPDEKVTDWESSVDRCSFRVDPVGRTDLQILEKEPHKLVKIGSDPEQSNYQFTIWIQLKQVAENDTRVKITIEPHVNMMVVQMIKGPLKKFADGLIDKIETFQFGSR